MKNILNLTGMILLGGVLFVYPGRVNGQEPQKDDFRSESIVASGGQFTLEKTALAGGGSRVQQIPTSVESTAGQSIAGYQSSGGQYKIYSGFWTPGSFAPTAAGVTVGGRVLTANGRGIVNAVIMIGFPTGQTRIARSSSLGYYSFNDIPAGATYTISVLAKRYVFNPPLIIRTVQEDLTDADFIANAESQ